MHKIEAPLSIVMYFAVLFILCGHSYGASQSIPDGKIYYIAEEKLYSVASTKTEKAMLVFSPTDDKSLGRVEIYGLSCGSNNDLLFGKIYSTGHDSTAHMHYVIASFNLDTKDYRTLVDLGETIVYSPILSPDGSKLAMCGGALNQFGLHIIIKDLKSEVTKHYEQYTPSGLGQFSWGPDSNSIIMTGVDEAVHKRVIYELDLRNTKLRKLLDGFSPRYSPDGKLLAYINDEQDKLIIVDRAGNIVRQFKGEFFKNVDSWIGENRILLTLGGFLYEDKIGIADLDKNKVYKIKVSTYGEIQGMCFKTSGQ